MGSLQAATNVDALSMTTKSDANQSAPQMRSQEAPLDSHLKDAEPVEAPKSFHPIYRKVKEDLIHRVLKGEWKPGEMLPSEKELAIEYGYSPGTIRKAVADLFAEGLVTRRAGRGTFVTSHRGDYKPPSFHPIYRNNGDRVAEDECLYLQCSQMKASERIASGLHIEPGELVSEIVRLRRCGERIAVVEKTYLSEELCPGAHTLIQRRRPHSLYMLLEEAYNLLITKVEEKVRARIVTDQEAALLEIRPDVPILEAERTAFSLGGHPIEWRMMVCETTDFYFFRG